MSILTYSMFMGACYFASAAWHLGLFLFLAALGMGGQWSVAVALIAECWPERHRPKLAGMLGAASYLGFLFIAVVGLTREISPSHWRWMMLVGASPALLALFISLGSARIATLEGGGGKKPPESFVRNLPPGHPKKNAVGHRLCQYSADRHLGRHRRLDALVGRPDGTAPDRPRAAFRGIARDVRAGADPKATASDTG